MDKPAATHPAGYRALVVDDERPLAGTFASYLEREMFEVAVAYNGIDALAVARETDPDLVVLDLGLPGIDGLEVCRQLRGFSDAYVVMLTARDTEFDTVVGLSVGADDYVTKPFSPRELVARIRAMLRRPRTAPTSPAAAGRGAGEPPPRVFGALRIDVAGREVFLDDEPVMLTRTEFDVSRRCRRARVWCCTAGNSSRPCGETPGWATNISSTCTSGTCAASSAMTPPHPDT